MKRDLYAIGVFILGLALFSAGSRAALDPLCDAGLWTKMVNRAHLQGQRETVVNENLIYKADSVLEYSCFNSFLSAAPPNASYYLITPLAASVATPAQSYITGNFGHTYLGGRVATDPTPPPLGASYACNVMAAVWDLAKCQNFAPQDPQDNFYDLSAFMTATNIRRLPTLPSACSGMPPISMGTVPAAATAIAFTPATSPVTPPLDCGAEIPSGNSVTVPLGPSDTRPETFNEKFCVNPACIYWPEGPGPDDGTCYPQDTP